MPGKAKLDYVITTLKGCIPYVVDTEKVFFDKTKKVYLDDMLFKDSFYDKGCRCSLKTFIGSGNEVAVGFRHKPSVLVSKRGNYKLTQGKYKSVLEAMECKFFADFGTGRLSLGQRDVIEPRDLDDFNKLAESHTLFGTQFIDDLVDAGMMLYIDDEKHLLSRHLKDTDLEYQKYLLTINEMNAYSFISENNYKVFHEYIEMKNKNE